MLSSKLNSCSIMCHIQYVFGLVPQISVVTSMWPGTERSVVQYWPLTQWLGTTAVQNDKCKKKQELRGNIKIIPHDLSLKTPTDLCWPCLCLQITRSGRIVPNKEYRHKLIQKAQQRHVHECLAQAIFHKVLEMEVRAKNKSTTGRRQIQPLRVNEGFFLHNKWRQFVPFLCHAASSSNRDQKETGGVCKKGESAQDQGTAFTCKCHRVVTWAGDHSSIMNEKNQTYKTGLLKSEPKLKTETKSRKTNLTFIKKLSVIVHVFLSLQICNLDFSA